MALRSPSKAHADSTASAAMEHGPSKTRDVILDVAEQIFATHGYVATSIRMIASGANITLGNLHYHFKSKESLYREVFERRGLPLVEERARLLAEALHLWPNGDIPLSELIRRFITPFLEATVQPGGEAFIRLHTRLASEPAALGEAVRSVVYDKTTSAYVAAFRQALPELSEEALYWRLHFMIGSNTYTLARSGRLEFISNGRCHSTDIAAALKHIVPFVEAGLRAPLPS